QRMGISLYGIGTRRRRGLWFKLVQRTNVSHDLPDLIFRKTPAPRGHPVRPAFHDRVEQIGRLIPVGPDIFDERRTNPASTVRVAPAAVVCVEQPLAFRD